MTDETKYVVVTRRNNDDTTYRNAVVCNTREEADALLDELSNTAGVHTVQTQDEFSAAQEKADNGDATTKNDEV